MLLTALLAGARSEAQVIGAPGDLRWDPTFGLYNADSDGDTLHWPAGTYYMDDDSGSNQVFVLSPQDPTGPHRPRTNLTINASGVTIVITNPKAGGFFLTECHGLVINGLTITYDPLPYNQSTIIGVNAGSDYLDVVLDPGYLPFEDPFFSNVINGQNNYGVLYDDATNLLKANAGANFCKLTSVQPILGSNAYRLHVDPQFHAYLQSFEVNDRFTYIGRMHGRNVMDMRRFEPTGAPFFRPPVTLDGCNFLASNSIAIVLRECPKFASSGQAVIRNCTVATDDPSRLVSTNASLAFAQDCRVGPLVENCTAERFSDDGIDFHGDAREFQGYPFAGNVTVADFDQGPRLAVGDTLQLFDPATGQQVQVEILGILGGGASDGDWQRVQMSAGVPGMVADTDLIAPDFTTLAWNVSTSCPGTVIRNNVFRAARGDGVVLNARGGSITGNLIEDVGQHGIVVANIAVTCCGQGPVSSDILIQGNTLKHCGFWSAQAAPGSSLYVAGLEGLSYYTPADFQTVSGVIVEGNTIERWNTHGVLFQAVKNSQIRPFAGVYNKFKGTVAAAARAITIGFPGSNILVDGVTTGGASGLTHAVRIEAGVASSVTATHIVVKPPTLALEDLR